MCRQMVATMNDGFVKWKSNRFKLVSLHVLGRTEEDHAELQHNQSVGPLKCETGV